LIIEKNERICLSIEISSHHKIIIQFYYYLEGLEERTDRCKIAQEISSSGQYGVYTIYPDKFCGKKQARLNILFLEIRIVRQNLFRRHTGTQKVKEHFDRIPHMPDSRLSITYFGIDRYPF